MQFGIDKTFTNYYDIVCSLSLASWRNPTKNLEWVMLKKNIEQYFKIWFSRIILSPKNCVHEPHVVYTIQYIIMVVNL